MKHTVDAFEQRLQGRLREVELGEPEAAIPEALLEVALLGGPRVVVGDGVDADDRAASSAQGLHEMRADEAGAARDQIGTAWPQRVARAAPAVAIA
jgi:hypothetical protein